MMHFYQFHIGDYKSHTHHLSLIEDLAFRRLLDHYYLHEAPIKQRDIARQIGMKDHEQEVLTVLDEFFISTEQGYVSPRADEEICKYRKFSEDGKKGAAIRWLKGGHRGAISPPNATPIATNNQEPRTKYIDTPVGVSVDVWQDFVKLRKAKKAPVTDNVVKLIQKEANLAGWSLDQALAECVVRGWQSFKADWVKPKPLFGDIAKTTVPSSNVRDPALQKLDEDARSTKPPPAEILAKIREFAGVKNELL
jgi:uncharacterized protein YdaU (DUF1376 family)